MMILDKSTILKSSVTWSLVAHLILLMLFAFISIRPTFRSVWHEIEWLNETEATIPPLPKTDTGVGAKEESVSGDDAANPLASVSDEPRITSPSEDQSITKTKVIEVPRITENSNVSTISKPATIPGSRGKVPRAGLPGSGSEITSSYSFDGDGSGIAVKTKVLPDLKISDFGEVKLEFSVRNNMTVDPTTISVIKSGTQPQNQSAIKALKQWTFTLTGVYNPSKRFSIVFRFNPS